MADTCEISLLGFEVRAGMARLHCFLGDGVTGGRNIVSCNVVVPYVMVVACLSLLAGTPLLCCVPKPERAYTHVSPTWVN
jgi:hypothetical protein